LQVAKWGNESGDTMRQNELNDISEIPSFRPKERPFKAGEND